MRAELQTKDGEVEQSIPIKRSSKNTRVRPESSARFTGSEGVTSQADELKLLNFKDLEWLAWNWRLFMY